MSTAPQVKFSTVAPTAADQSWYVRATLPHGEQVLLHEFPTQIRAKEWIANEAAAWLKKFRGGRYG